TVNVWDLILLLNAYGSTSESVNTPFAPQITSVTLHSSPDQYQVNWSMPYPSDVHEQFTLYGLNATTTFSTTTNVVGVFPKTTVSTVVPLNTAYVGLCAVNTSPPTTYYSDPFFFPVPSAPSAEVSFETNAMSVPVGSTFTVRVVASGLPTFQSARLQILKTGGISIQGVSAGTVYNTNARVFHSSQGGGLENFDSTHLYGQSSAFNSGVLLTLTCQATSPGTLGFSSMSALDSTLSTRAPSLGPSFSVSVY
ncbi:MAG TPA: hypothetical protein P5560_14445, partial [Thermotogota bacterium]|nr:hypothetical protein [Thermotogota bacterium]